MKRRNVADIRTDNLNVIWNVLQRKKELTRQAIARETGLSLMSITNLVDQLRSNGAIRILVPEASGQKRVGRTAEIISIENGRFLWLIINLADRYHRFYLLNLERTICYSSLPYEPGEMTSYTDYYHAFLENMLQYLAPYMERIIGIAAIVPGPYDADTDLISNARIPELNSIPINETIGKTFPNRVIYVDEDVKFAARAYAELYENLSSVYYLYIGEGVGGALVCNGTIYRGLNAMAGDAGILIFKEGKTFEELVSLHSFAKGLISDGLDRMDAEQTLSALRNVYCSDPDTFSKAIEKAAEAIAEVLDIAEAMLDPHVAIIDCCYAQWMREDFEKMLRKAKKQSHLWRKPLLISTAPLSISAPCLGAVKALERSWMKSVNGRED